MQNTNLMVGGKRVVVLGYGWCGKGIARYAAGLGARVSVCEVDPVRGLEAYADGFDVLPAIDAAEMGEVFITATGSTDVLTAPHFERMRDGAILANAGGVDVEIDVEGLRASATGAREVRRNVEEFAVSGDRRIYLVGRGMVVNLTAGDGHPVEIMDLTFAIRGARASQRNRRRGGPHEARCGKHGRRRPDAGAGRVPGRLARVEHHSLLRTDVKLAPYGLQDVLNYLG
jgi:adenosylhomocysteinase